MTNPFNHFIAEGKRLTELVYATEPSDTHLDDFLINQKRIDYLRDIIARVAVLAHCYDAIYALTEQWNNRQECFQALPTDPGRPNTRTIPQDFQDEEEHWRVEVDAFTSLIYYEVTSVVRMLRQLDISIDSASEVQYLVKVRDRFLSHVQLSGLARGAGCGWSIPRRGFVDRDVVSLSSWSADQIRALGKRALQIGSPAWGEQRRRNEQLVLSRKRNESFTNDELLDLMAAGVRECRLELALQQLSEILDRGVLPIIEHETQQALEVFGWWRSP